MSCIDGIRVFRTQCAALVLAVTVIAAAADALQAQTPQFMNGSAGTTSNVIPFGSTTNKMENHYLAGEIAGAYAGNITKVYFRRGVVATSTFTNFKIWLGQTTSTFPTCPGAYSTGVTLCLSSAAYTIPASTATGWFGMQLTTPFYYNPSQTLVIIICHEGYTTGFGILRQSTLGNPATRRVYGAGGANCATASASCDGVIYDFGIDMSSAAYNDAGISSLVSPVAFCAGSYDIAVSLKNYGAQNLTSARVRWIYDGVQQSDYQWAGTLASLAEVPITLGNRTFAAGITHPLKVWTEMPNGVNDSSKANDTLTTNLRPAMSGIYTIGGATPNYATFQAAAADLFAYGVCGPVVFRVRSGTYNEHIAIGAIAGASAINTVIFESESGNKADVTVTWNSAGVAADNYVIRFSGCDWLTIRNMTLTATNATYGAVVDITGVSEHCTIENMELVGVPTTSTSGNLSVIYSATGTLDNYTTVRGCTVRNGSYSILLQGTSSTVLEVGNVVENNTVLSYSYAGIYLTYGDATIVRGNYLSSSVTTVYVMLTLSYCMNKVQVLGNRIYIPITTGGMRGLFVNYCTSTAGNEGIWANNMVYMYGGPNEVNLMLVYNSYFQKVLFNTNYTNSTYATGSTIWVSGGANCTFKNNIFYNAGTGYAGNFISPTAVLASDYNLFYTGGATLAVWSGARATLAALQAASGKDLNSKSKTVTFANPTASDLHLAGASQNDAGLTGTMLGEVPADFDGDLRVVPYMGADEACFVIASELSYALVDAQGNPQDYAEVPGTFYVQYSLNYPAAEAVALTVNLRFYDPYTNALVWQTSFNANKLAGVPLSGIAAVTVPPTVPTGAFRVEVSFNTKNSCGAYIDFPMPATSILFVPQGAVPCQVWPGDANNNGVVNYGDRSALNGYIQNANLNPTWIYGPRRYRPDAATNALTYYTWTAQASSPWATPDGCYMDVDGNGTVNGFDYIGIRVNWLKTHGATPKSGPSALVPETFDMSQNYPNPFNPATSLTLAVPEASSVQLVVTDMLGREVATLVSGTLQTGLHTVQFNAASLPSGQYLATVRMTGNASGLGFSKVVKMTLSK